MQQVNKQNKRTVTFGNVTIREYPITLSDNPVPSYGPAIGLDWEYIEERTAKVDGRALYLAPVTREKYLEGYAKKEVQKAIREKEWVQFQRRLSQIRTPSRFVSTEAKVWRRTKKVQRALRNMNKPATELEDGFVKEGSNIYGGWALPVSAYVL